MLSLLFVCLFVCPGVCVCVCVWKSSELISSETAVRISLKLLHRVCPAHCVPVFGDATLFKIYLQTKFRRHMPIQGWDITTSGLDKQTYAISDLFYGFWFSHCRISFLSDYQTNFIHIGQPAAETMMSYQFAKWRPQLFYVGFRTWWRRPLESISKLNVVGIIQYTTEIPL